jgi:Ni/Co efflux regulator RcnB
MKKTILALALVASSFGAFAVQTPAASKKVAPKTEKQSHKAKKDTVAKKATPAKVVKPAKAAKPAKAKG